VCVFLSLSLSLSLSQRQAALSFERIVSFFLSILLARSHSVSCALFPSRSCSLACTHANAGRGKSGQTTPKRDQLEPEAPTWYWSSTWGHSKIGLSLLQTRHLGNPQIGPGWCSESIPQTISGSIPHQTITTTCRIRAGIYFLWHPRYFSKIAIDLWCEIFWPRGFTLVATCLVHQKILPTPPFFPPFSLDQPEALREKKERFKKKSPGPAGPNAHKCNLGLQRSGTVYWVLHDHSDAHHPRRYWRSVRFHLLVVQENTVDIVGRFDFTYGELLSISMIDSIHSTKKSVDIDHPGWFIRLKIGRQSISTV